MPIFRVRVRGRGRGMGNPMYELPIEDQLRFIKVKGTITRQQTVILP